MAKFRRRSEYPKKETTVEGPIEQPEVAQNRELTVIVPCSTIPDPPHPQETCGIDGCTTWYNEPEIMAKHRKRVHGIGLGEGLNIPMERNSEIKVV